MKIIDIHAHTGEWLVHSRITDADISGMLDKFEIEKAVFSSGFALMNDLSLGNGYNYEFVLKDDRYYAYVVVNPNRMEESIKQLSVYLGRKKVVGVKMHPEQFEHPVNSERNKELLEIIDSYGLPILIHTAHFEVSRPSHVLEIAKQFKNNKYILAHMGNAWWQEAVRTASLSDNIYIDIVSSWCVFDQIRYACEVLGPQRVLYGSDLDLLDPSMSIGMVQSSEISQEDKEKVFYKNALELFDLK